VGKRRTSQNRKPAGFNTLARIGVTVVTSRVGGLPEMIRDGETGLLYEQDDQSALVAALGRLLADRAYAGRIAAAGRRQVEAQHTLRQMFQEYDRHYRELLTGTADARR
jgi:glycosyltransferase involved in cell wall biosynthesis